MCDDELDTIGDIFKYNNTKQIRPKDIQILKILNREKQKTLTVELLQRINQLTNPLIDKSFQL